MSMIEKRCPRCGVVKLTSEFVRDRTKASGLGSRCHECDAEKSRTYYHANRDRKRAYYLANIERVRAYYRDNKDRINAATRAAMKAAHARDRTRAIEIYGGECVACGATDRLEFDHIDWNGDQHRQTEKSGEMVRRIARLGRPLDDYRLRLLCRSCHHRRIPGTHVIDFTGR